MLSDLMYRLRALLRFKKVEEELDEELRFHIEQETEANLASNSRREDAFNRAVAAFGGVEQVKEECREARGVTWVTSALRDAGLPYAC